MERKDNWQTSAQQRSIQLEWCALCENFYTAFGNTECDILVSKSTLKSKDVQQRLLELRAPATVSCSRSPIVWPMNLGVRVAQVDHLQGFKICLGVTSSLEARTGSMVNV